VSNRLDDVVRRKGSANFVLFFVGIVHCFHIDKTELDFLYVKQEHQPFSILYPRAYLHSHIDVGPHQKDVVAPHCA